MNDHDLTCLILPQLVAPAPSPESPWQPLAEAAARDLGVHPDPVSVDAVLRHFETLAAQAARHLPSVRDRLIDDAAGAIVEAFAGFDRSRPFAPWAWKVLYRHGIDLLRRERNAPVSLQSSLLDVESPTSDVAARLADLLGDFRQLCDVARAPRRTKVSPDYLAVFALETRLRLVPKLIHLGTGFIDDHLPLRPHERAACIHDGWPTVAELWAHLAPDADVLDNHPAAVRAARLALAPGLVIQESATLWNTWAMRAHAIVERQTESHAQARLLAYLYPSRAD